MSNRAGGRAGNTALSPWLLHGSMLVSAVLVSTSFPVGKAITPFMDPVLLTLIRFCLAALLFAPYVRRRFGLANPGLAALRETDGHLLFAHSDLSGYSVFEEAAWWGDRAGRRVLG